MSEKIMVSVMCTAFNHVEYIREALDSMLNQQTDFAYEILVNDDCSTDGTAEVVHEYAEKYPDRIRAFFPEKNLYSQNIDVYYHSFFPNARGKYVAFCEGDDYWTDPTKLQRQVDFLEAHEDYSACVHNTTLHYCDAAQPDTALVKHEEDCDIGFELILPGMDNAWHTSSLLARTEVLASPPDYYHIASEHGFGDFPYGLMVRNAAKVRFLNREMSVYRLNSNQAAWSSGFDYVAKKRIFVLEGMVLTLEAFRRHVKDEAVLRLVDENLDEALFRKYKAQGDAKMMLQPRFKKVFSQRPISFRAKIYLNYFLPGLHKLYRKLKGYE